MSEIDGEQIKTDIHEFNNHNSKRDLNCDDNIPNRDVPNDGGIQSHCSEESKSGAVLVNPNVKISDSVDRGDKVVNSEFDPGKSDEKEQTNFGDTTDGEKEKVKDEKEDLSETRTENVQSEKDENSDKVENLNVSDNKTDDELLNKQLDERVDLNNEGQHKTLRNNTNKEQSNGCLNSNDIASRNSEQQSVDRQSVDSEDNKSCIKVSDVSLRSSEQKEATKETPSKVKHVTFRDNEDNFEDLILNYQTDEDKEKQLNDSNINTGKDNRLEDIEENSKSDATESWPSYNPDISKENIEKEPGENNQVSEQENKLDRESTSPVHSEASESWPSYKPDNQKESEPKEKADDTGESNKSEVLNESRSEASESFPSYKPSSEQDNTLEALNTDTSKEKESVSRSEASGTFPSYRADSVDEKENKSSSKENFEIDKGIRVETQVAPITTETPKQKSDQNSKSDQADDSFPSYEPDVTPVNAVGDDTLDDIEPISTVAVVPGEEPNSKPVENMEKENEAEKSDTTKSEVADDQARADDAPKRDANDDTDLETTDELKSEELTDNKKSDRQNEQDKQSDSQNQNESEEAKHTSLKNDDSENSQSVKQNIKPEHGEQKTEVQQETTKSPTPDQKEPEPTPKVEEKPKSPEPIEMPVIRNVNVDKAVETLSDLESNVEHLMTEIKHLMGDYHSRLSAQPLSDFVLDLDKFKGDFVSVGEAYKKCESLSILLNKCLKDLRHATDDVNILISKKFREEDLATWVDDADQMEEDKEKLREERIAVERSALARASEARSAIAHATTGVSESKLFASEAEVEAAETSAIAKRAWEIAENARRTAEEAKKAAVEKRKAEEEARKRAQERAKQKAEEEKKKREAENVLLKEEAIIKGTTFEDERRRADEEQARKEAERKNPKNWPRNIYSIEPGDFDPGIGCIIRSIDGSLGREEVEVKRIDQMSGILTLGDNEELISNIIEIVQADPEKKYSFEEPISISIPHCFSRGTHGREPVVKTLQSNGKWIEVPTSDVSFEDIKELRFVEMRTRRFGVFVVVSRLKHDNHVFSRKGNKVTSSVDPRITLTCRPGMFKMNVNFHIEVQSVDSTSLSEVKNRKPEECGNILTTSPILRFHIANKKFSKPVMVTMPLPVNITKPKRPTTAAINRDKDDQSSESRPPPVRPGTAYTSSIKEDDADEEIHLLAKGHLGHWTRLQNITLVQSKNKDIVTFDLPDPYERLVLLRMKKGVLVQNLDKIPPLLELSLNHKSIQFYLRQKNIALNNIKLSCANTGRTDRYLRNLAEDGYEEGPKPTKDIIVKEGQVLYVRFRGNLKCLTDVSDLKFIFNTHIKSGLEFNVIELDKFAQKSFHFYRGFARIYTTVKVSRELPPQESSSSGHSSKQKPQYEIVDEEVLLAELIINLPKPDPEPPQPLNTAPVKIKEEGPVTDDILEFVATELGDEWKRLAQFLNLKRMRIQAILRQNNTNPDPKKIRLDMLMSWAKRLPRCVNKVEILAHALESSGRADISEVLRDRDTEFRRQRADSAKDSVLRRAFIKVAQNPVAVRDWKSIAKRLGVSENDLTEIDKTKPSVQEKCFHSLKKWQVVAGESATLPTLSAKLRVFKHHRQLAREIETIG